MKRQRSSSDSLDLLLDAVTNTFGGVLFVAVLAALLMRLTSESKSPQSSTPQQREQARQVQIEILQLKSKRDGLQAALAQSQAAVSLLAEGSTDEYRAYIRLQEELAAAKKGMSKLSKQSKEEEKSRKRVEKQSELTKKQLAELTEEVARLRKKLEREEKARTRTAQLPSLRKTRKIEFPLLMRYGHIAAPYNSLEDRRAQRVNREDILVSRSPAGNPQMTLKRKAGVSLQGPKMKDQVRALLRGLNPQTTYLAIAVWEDSFAEYASFKEAIVELGFEYRLLPWPNDELVTEASVGEVYVQ